MHAVKLEAPKKLARAKKGSEPMEGISESVIQSLREQGFEIHESVMSTEGMIYGVRSTAVSAWVKGGEELLDLAAGRVTLAEISARQPKRKLAPKDD